MSNLIFQSSSQETDTLFNTHGMSKKSEFIAVVCTMINFKNTSYNLPAIIDDYEKDGGPGVPRLLCSFYHEPLRSLIVKEV